MNPAQSIYIQAILKDSISVLMAEAAAMALAAEITERLNLNNINFLSDNQQLVQYFNSADLSTPPEWKIKHLAQIFINSTRQRNAKILKIGRTLNHTAHTLAKQAFDLSQPADATLGFSCSNRDHVSQCPLMAALQSVLKDSVSVLTVRCC